MTHTSVSRPPSRRALLRGILLGGAGFGLAACAVSQSGGVTTVTLDVARIVTDGRAIVAAMDTALAIPAVAVFLGGNLAIAQAALAAGNAAMTEIVQITGGTVTVTINTAHVQSLVLSLLGNVQTVLALLQPSPVSDAATSTRLQLLVTAAATLVPLVHQAAGLATTAPRRAPMSEADALRIARGA